MSELNQCPDLSVNKILERNKKFIFNYNLNCLPICYKRNICFGVQVRELGNPKSKKSKEVPAFSEVCEPCKQFLDSGEEIPLPLLAKLIKYRLLAIKSIDMKRIEALKKVIICSLCMCVCIYIYLCVCVCDCVPECVHMFVCVQIKLQVNIYGFHLILKICCIVSKI